MPCLQKQKRLTENFAAWSVFRDDVDHIFGHHDLEQLNDVGMVQQLHDLDLAVDLLQVGLVQLALVDDFDRNLQRETNIGRRIRNDKSTHQNIKTERKRRAQRYRIYCSFGGCQMAAKAAALVSFLEIKSFVVCTIAQFLRVQRSNFKLKLNVS